MLYKERPTIGLFAEILPVGYFFPLFQGIVDTCNERDANLRLFLGSHLDSPSNFNSYKNIIYKYAGKQNVDGIITTSPSMGRYATKENFFKFISAISVPKISLGLDIEGIHSIIVNNRESLYKTVCHLIRHHGYKKIAYIGGPERNPEATARFEGYSDALAENNISFNPNLYVEGRFHVNSGVKACEILFEQRKVTFDAIVCANDEMALGVYHYCKTHQVNIPGEVAVTGFDNVIDSHNLTPLLTTVAQPFYGMGKAAVNNLIDLIENRPVKITSTLPATLLLRSSCGCPNLDRTIKDNALPEVPIRDHRKKELLKTLENLQNDLSASYIAKHQEKLFSLLKMVVKMINHNGDNQQQIEKIQTYLRNTNAGELEMITWIDVTRLFYTDLKKLECSQELEQKIDHIFFLIHHLLHIALRHKVGSMKIEQRLNFLPHKEILNSLSSCISLKTFFRVLKKELVTYGYKYFYISLFEGKRLGLLPNQKAGKKMKLFIGYDGENIMDGRKKNILFNPEELMPHSFFPSQKPHSFLAFPLIEKKYHFGTFVIDYQERFFHFYEQLYEQLCTSLNIIRLFENSRKG